MTARVDFTQAWEGRWIVIGSSRAVATVTAPAIRSRRRRAARWLCRTGTETTLSTRGCLSAHRCGLGLPWIYREHLTVAHACSSYNRVLGETDAGTKGTRVRLMWRSQRAFVCKGPVRPCHTALAALVNGVGEDTSRRQRSRKGTMSCPRAAPGQSELSGRP